MLFFFLNNWKSGNTTRPSQPHPGGYGTGGSTAKALFSKAISHNDTKGAIPLDNMDEGVHTKAPSRDSRDPMRVGAG